MSEALLFRPYGDIRTFFIGQIARGDHRTRPNHLTSNSVSYVATLRAEGLLQTSRIWRWRSLSTADPVVFGPHLNFNPNLFPSALTRSTGWKFFDSLFVSDVETAFRPIAKSFRLLEIVPLPEGVSQIRLEVDDAEDMEVLDLSIQFAKRLLLRADALVAENSEWLDAATMVDAEGVKAASLSADEIDAVVSTARHATGWLSGVVERIGDDVDCHLSLPTEIAPLSGNIRLVPFLDDNVRRARLAADVALPEANVEEARLLPEKPGIVGWLARLGEIEIGDKEVDDRFRIFASEGAAPLLLRAKPSLLALARWGATVRISANRLVVTAGSIPVDDPTVARVIEAIGLLWRECAEQRAGIVAIEDD